MDSVAEETPTVLRLAERLETDIQRRRLHQGARYLNTIEAGHMLGVSPATAHRAMRVLVDRQMIVRRSRAGTFVGPGAGASDGSRLRTVYVLISPEKSNYLERRARSIMRGIRRANADLDIQFNFLPPRDQIRYVNELIGFANSGGEAVGFLATSCHVEVYDCLAESGVPAVIAATRPVDGPKLPSVDLDSREAGRMLVRYLVQRGHRRMALLATTFDWPGDKLFFDGLSCALTTAQLPHNSLVLQVVSDNMKSVSAITSHLLEGPDPPTAIIGRSELLAEMIGKALASLGSPVPEDLDIVFVDHRTERVEQSPYAHVQTEMHSDDSYALMGEMVHRIAQGETLDDREVILPVEFCHGRLEKNAKNRRESAGRSIAGT